MAKAKIVEVPEGQNIVCPVCHTLIVDQEEGLVSQPSCAHIRFIYANGEVFEYAEPGLEKKLEAQEQQVDEKGDVFDVWDALRDQCGKGDLVLEQVTGGMACGSFQVWVGISTLVGILDVQFSRELA